jgi:hypothetical protein
MSSFPVEVREATGLGKAVVALEDLDPGLHGVEALRERALIVFPPRGSPGDLSGPPPWTASREMDPELWSTCWYFLQQDKDTQNKVMSFYSETDTYEADRVREFLRNYSKIEDIETFVSVIMVRKFNAVSMQPPSKDGGGLGRDYGAGLFEVACHMAHSCRPNCTWFTSQDGTEKIVRVLRPIKAGEALTVDYLGKEFNTKPVEARRWRLLSTKNFLCKCERCDAEKDDTRRFRCTKKRCGGFHFASTGSDDPETSFLLDCTVCGVVASDKFQQTMLQKEEEARTSTEYLDRVSGYMDVCPQILSLRPPHPLHGVGLHIYELKYELYSQMRDFASAADAQRKYIACRKGMVGDDFYDESAGFGYERLGDVYAHGQEWPKAQDAYQDAVHSFQIAYGDVTHPYYKCAVDKLLSVQRRMEPQQAPRPNRCGLCGVAAKLKCIGYPQESM